MISAMIACRDPELISAATEYITNSTGLTLVERTDKGEVAIPAILGLRPDVVICGDMEQMDQAALLEATFPYALNTFYLLCDVSGDFDALLSLFRSGAGDVLKKPWTRETLFGALDRFLLRFDSRKQKSLASHSSRLRNTLDKKFFEDTVVTDSGNAILSDLSAIDYEYQIPFVLGWFQCLYMIIDPRPKEELCTDSFLPILEIEGLAREFFGSRSSAIVCYVVDRGLSVILNTKKQISECRKLCRQFLTLCQKQLPWYSGQNTISIGVGLPSENPEEIPLLMESSKYACWMRLGEGKGRILEYSKYRSTLHRKQEYLPEYFAMEIRESVASFDEPRLTEAIDGALAGAENAGSFVSAAVSINDVLISAFNDCPGEAVVENSKYLRLAKNMPPMVEKLDTLEQIQREITRWARHCMQLLRERSYSREDSAMWAAKHYISANYTNTLRLEDVAGEVHLAPSYFSMKFKKTTGQTFIEYLTELRLERAKNLLLHSDLKIHEVAVAVGFADSRHFSRTFKSRFGMLPTDFRRKG